MEDPYEGMPMEKAAWQALRDEVPIAELAKLNNVDETTIEHLRDDFARRVAFEVLFGFHDSGIYKKLVTIGDELNKVRWYANEHVIEDYPSKGINNICISSYFAGVVPLIKLEAGLFYAEPLRNELVKASLIRSYMEFAGRIHKGARILRNFIDKKYCPKQFYELSQRLIYEHVKDGEKTRSIMYSGGFSISALVYSLDDKIGSIRDSYGTLSTYINGDYWNQQIISKMSYIFIGHEDKNPLRGWHTHNMDLLDRLRVVVMEDFDLMIRVTEKPRRRFDAHHDR
jgi:hypothetical protein